MKTGDWEVNEMQNILAALFEKESEGFQAITELRQNPIADKYAILQMGLVKREGDKRGYQRDGSGDKRAH